MKEQQLKIIAEKYANDECSEEEKKTVEAFFDEMQNTKSTTNLKLLDANGEKIFSSIKTKTIQRRKKKNRRRILHFAAIAILFLSIGLAFKTSFKSEKIIQITSTSQKKEIILADGSTVVLNRNSSISYPEKFGNIRDVKLTGEAYFKVKRNPEKPFIVTMHDLTLQVLGTSFNINSYASNPTKVSVLTGIVSLNSKSGKKLVLVKNQQAYLNDNSGYHLTNEKSDDEIEWTNNTIVLKKTTLKATAKILENWYGVTIDFEDKDLEQLILSGKFKDESLHTILTSIAFVKKLKVDYLTKTNIIIRRNPD